MHVYARQDYMNVTFFWGQQSFKLPLNHWQNIFCCAMHCIYHNDLTSMFYFFTSPVRGGQQFLLISQKDDDGASNSNETKTAQIIRHCHCCDLHEQSLTCIIFMSFFNDSGLILLSAGIFLPGPLRAHSDKQIEFRDL